MRSFGRLGIVLAAFAAANLLSAGGGAVRADMISTTPVTETSSAPAAEVNRVALETKLQSLGLTANQADQRLATLTDEDVSSLAQAPEQVQMAGNHLIIVGIALALLILGFWYIESYNQREKNKA
ncbi:MAG: hypothetical protein HYZ53_01895 [Planctomycetes bacterium]|nr:hypothetical protein [Planctomycetota bacterium]